MKLGAEGLGKVTNTQIYFKTNSGTVPSKIGQVIGIVSGENMSTPTQYIRAGGEAGIGSILYQEVNTDGAKVIDIYDEKLYESCKIAKPVSSLVVNPPLIGELVQIVEDFPSADDKINGKAAQTYYLGTINTWGSPQQNSVDGTNLGLTFKQNDKVKNIRAFDGDHIIQGRQGSALRFSSTTKLYKNLNEWSTIGNEDDPITILTNGFNYTTAPLQVESINKDKSSLYLTSTQKIPLITTKKGNLVNFGYEL